MKTLPADIFNVQEELSSRIEFKTVFKEEIISAVSLLEYFSKKEICFLIYDLVCSLIIANNFFEGSFFTVCIVQSYCFFVTINSNF